MSLLISPARTTRTRSDSRAPRIIARSLFKELKQNGFQSGDIVSITSELIGLVTSELKDREGPAQAD